MNGIYIYTGILYYTFSKTIIGILIVVVKHEVILVEVNL
jgi:hypothetical protein